MIVLKELGCIFGRENAARAGSVLQYIHLQHSKVLTVHISPWDIHHVGKSIELGFMLILVFALELVL